MDLIIVGGGTAGCVLAERLTASGRLNVMLIEAGGDPSSQFVKIPAGFPRLFKSKLDWAYESEPQSSASGRIVFTPRGKMLGGSSNMNAQIHQWCHPADFEEWVAAGAVGWGWNDVVPVFRAQECWQGEQFNVERGSTGPMKVSQNQNAHRLSHAFVEAARTAGIGDQPCYNGGPYAGAWICELAHEGGRRFSVYDAYLKPALRRQNLTVLRHAHVTRLNLDDGHATGVTVSRGGSEETYSAPKVVLAAGAFGSPQLLMLSGVGPADRLTELGISMKCDSPEVGKNLQDHPLAPILIRTRGTDTMRKADSPFGLLKYLSFKRGMLASNGIEAIAFSNSKGRADSPPDIELLFAPFEWRNQGLEPPQIDAFGIAVSVIAPRSRGSVRLTSSDPFAPPAIDLGLLSDPDGADSAALVAGARLARKIQSTPPLANYNAGEMFPGEKFDDDADLVAKLHTELQTVYHPTSTCRMGSDSGAVVDPQLKVRGLSGLWVADASVMPSVPRGHPNAVVAMIAHRAADGILDQVG